MAQVSTATGGTVVAFRPDALRIRRQFQGDERGSVLLFTGIRYERPASTQPSTPASVARRRPDKA